MAVNTFRLLGLTLALALTTTSHAQQSEPSVESTPQEINTPAPQVPEQTQDNPPATPTGEYSTVFQDKVDQIELIFHKRLIDSDSRTATEDDLMIMVRSQPPKSALSQLMSVASMASSIKNGQIPIPLRNLFGKDHGKPAKLEPEFKNPTLEHARPIFNQWIQANASQLAPAQQPLQKVSIESNRFVLINAKKLKKTDYQLFNEIHITLQTATHAYTHKCEMLSNALDIETWQAEQYQAVNQAVQSNLQQCIADLDKNKARIATAFTAKL